MSNGEFLSTVAAWIRSRTLDGSLAGSQISRFSDLYGLLKEGIVHFWFRKSDGSLRSAYGTLDMAIIERHGGVPEGEERKGRPFSGAVSYYDLEKDAWRSFKADSVQEVDFGYGID
ncbi:MAG: DUF2693 domain-containing protein [Bacteroidales bacterium]|nr:DUF2693 domain-containing protein [Bacteroidales bacterium]